MLKTSDATIVVAVAGSGGAGAFVDLWTRRVPNWMTLTVTSVGITLAALGLSGTSVTGALLGFALGMVLMLPGHLIGATGAGDVKLFAALGTLLGPRGIAIAMVYTAIAGGVIALVVATRRRRLADTFERTAALVYTAAANVAEIEHSSADNRFAYAPAIAVGALVAALGW